MRISIHSLARRIARLSHAARAQLRRPREIATVLLIGISLAEPLLCIVHCQIWLPFMLGQHAAMAHHHHMPGMDMGGMRMPNMDMSTMNMAGMSMPGMGASSEAPATPAVACHIRGTAGSDVPFHIPPSPVHELVLTFVLATAMLLLIRHLPAEMAQNPPSPFIPPPFQPPRPFAIWASTARGAKPA